MIQSDSLYNTVQEMMASKRESDNWDFKQAHHIDKADLLHDIICMANNRTNRDGYIIFGVKDGTFEIVGVEADDANRRNQQQMITFLKDKKFAADIRPTVEVRAFKMSGYAIDVLIIKNTLDTPYYLTQDYKDNRRPVKANHIYTRVGDTNTDIDKSADFIHVEYLWKKRFGLHLTPHDKVKHLLRRREDWIKNDEGVYHHVMNPEFTITIEDKKPDKQQPRMFYSYIMQNSQTAYGVLKIRYYNTTLYSQQMVILEGGKYSSSIPSVDRMYSEEGRIDVAYFVQEDISYLLHLWLLDPANSESCEAMKRLYKVILIYKSHSEKQSFTHYVNSNRDIYNRHMFVREHNSNSNSILYFCFNSVSAKRIQHS